MARITVEDSRSKIQNKFALVVLTAQRVRELASGAKPTVQAKNKEVVLALREIAEDKVSPEILKEALVAKHQVKRKIEQDDPYRTSTDLFNNEEAWKAFNETASGIEQGAATRSEPELEASDLDAEEEDQAEDGDEPAPGEPIFSDEEEVD